MKVQDQFDLKEYNSFGITSIAKFYVSIANLADLRALMLNEVYAQEKRFILGGGSNILLQDKFEGLVIHLQMRGKQIVFEDNEHIWIQAESGENWHEFVQFCVDQNWAGIENLSLIPGSVGAAPMQNIGAYGVEIVDVFHSLEAINLRTGEIRTFQKEHCQFGYRTSIFKTDLKDQYAILSVTFRLDKKPKFKLEYGAVKEIIDKEFEGKVSLSNVSGAICRIRSRKLPDPKEIGNSGSFFKNAFVTQDKFTALKSAHPEIPGYTGDDDLVKIPSAWLIEACGWKGKAVGNTGTYEKHALVLVNHGNASGAEVLSVSEDIIASVFEKFQIRLEREVNIIE